ncbi:MAG: response regulator transcription factor [Syntrophales bacterium]|jgi:DNA-binding NarL/FixJ family response regulator
MSEKELITVAMIDYDKDFFENSLALFRKEKDIEVCVPYLWSDYRKETASTEAAANDILKYQPKVLILSQLIIKEAAARDLKSILNIRGKIPNTRVMIIFDQLDDEETALILIREGIRGFYLRSSGPSQIVPCVRALARGEVWMEASLIGRVIEEFSKLYMHVESLHPPTKGHEARLSLLSHREMEVLGLISKSYTNMDIGKKLFISEKTVKTHINNIFEKLGVRNRVEATLVLVRSGLTH